MKDPDPEADIVRQERTQWLDPVVAVKCYNPSKRDWGTYEIIAQGEGWLTKIITIEPRKNISFQRHFHREERWLVLEVEGEFFSAEAGRWPVKPSDQIQIPVNNSHWIANTSHDKNLIILETWLGDKLEESDIERIENELTIS